MFSMISQTPTVSQHETRMNVQMTFDEETQQYQRILNKISECQILPEGGFDVFDVFAVQEISTLMLELQKLIPNSPQFNAKWRVVQNTIVILQSWQNRVHGTTFTRFNQHSRADQIQIQELMHCYLSSVTPY